MHYILLFFLILIPLNLWAQTELGEPTIVIAPYDQSPNPHESFRFLAQFDGELSGYDVIFGAAIAPKYKNIYEKNIGYVGLGLRTGEDYELWRLGVFVDSYQSFKSEEQGNLKTRLNFYKRIQNKDEDIGIGLGLHALFQPKRNLFYSIGFEARPVFLTFDWKDKTYFEMDINQEFKAYFSSNFALYTRWLMVGQFEGSAAIVQPINRLSFGLTIQR